jgi:hypothetical protein
MLRSRPRVRAAIVGFLAFLPIAAGWAHKEWVHPRTFWMFWYDPELSYFHSGRELADGQVPRHVDHPGTPVQLFSAALVSIVGGHPQSVESFLQLAHLLAISLACASVVLLTICVLGDLSWPCQVSGVWIFYCCGQSLEYSNVWSPETLFATFGSLLVIFIWRAVVRDLEVGAVFVAGVALGACCSLKFTFLPLALAFVVGLLLATDLSRGVVPIVGVGGVLAGFLAATALVWRGYGRMFGFLTRLALRDGAYGVGPAGLPDLSVAVAHEAAALAGANGWYVLVSLLVGFVLTGLWRSARVGRPARAGIRFAVMFAMVGIAATHLLIIRHAALRYLLPSAFCVLVLFRVAAAFDPLRGARRLQFVVLLGIAVVLARHLWLDADVHDRRIAECLSLHSAIARTIGGLGVGSPPVVIYGFRAPQPSFALRVEAGDEEFQEEVDRLFPYEGHWTWLGQIRIPSGRNTWDLLVVDQNRLSDPGLPQRPVAGVGNFVIFSNHGQ